MNPLFTTYTGNGYDAAILEARRQNPNHRGNVIAIPRGLERLLKVCLEHGQAAALALPFSRPGGGGGFENIKEIQNRVAEWD